MSWVPLMPAENGHPKGYPVTVTVNKAHGRFRQRMLLTVRLSAVETLAHWLKPGASVTVESGRDEHAGQLRVTPAGPWKFRASSGRIRAVSLSLPAPPGSPPDGCKQSLVAFSHGPGFLAVTLPTWGVLAARARDLSPAAEARPVDTRTARRQVNAGGSKEPFVGICDRVPDPGLALHPNGSRPR